LNLKRRNKIEIILDILTLCSVGSNKSNILYRCNLNSTRLTPLLETLLHMGLLDKAGNFDQKVVYMTTLQGSRFIKSYLNGKAKKYLK
jgi:predicted transcriptional regulator